MKPFVTQVWPQFTADQQFCAAFGSVLVDRVELYRTKRQVVICLRSAEPLDQALCGRLCASLAEVFAGYELQVRSYFAYPNITPEAVRLMIEELKEKGMPVNGFLDKSEPVTFGEDGITVHVSAGRQILESVELPRVLAEMIQERTGSLPVVRLTDSGKARTEEEDYYAAVSFLAQTALREAVGRSTVAEVALRRDQLDAEIKDDIEKEAAGWGVDIISVKVRDIVIPDELQEVMSLEAQADREKNARMTVVGVEAELAEMLAEAARVYGDPEAALKLRTMLMQYDTVKKSKGTVVTVPTAMSDGFTDSAMMNGDRTTER